MAKSKSDINVRPELSTLDLTGLDVEIRSLLVEIENEAVPERLVGLASRLQTALQEKKKKPH